MQSRPLTPCGTAPVTKPGFFKIIFYPFLGKYHQNMKDLLITLSYTISNKYLSIMKKIKFKWRISYSLTKVEYLSFSPWQHPDSKYHLKKRITSLTLPIVPSSEASKVFISAPILESTPVATPQLSPSFEGTSKIDQYSRVLFPVAFSGFNLVYWIVYLSKDTMEVSESVE